MTLSGPGLNVFSPKWTELRVCEHTLIWLVYSQVYIITSVPSSHLIFCLKRNEKCVFSPVLFKGIKRGFFHIFWFMGKNISLCFNICFAYVGGTETPLWSTFPSLIWYTWQPLNSFSIGEKQASEPSLFTRILRCCHALAVLTKSYKKKIYILDLLSMLLTNQRWLYLYITYYLIYLLYIIK